MIPCPWHDAYYASHGYSPSYHFFKNKFKINIGCVLLSCQQDLLLCS